MPTPLERVAWRNDNADLIEFINTPAQQRASRFIASMAESLAQWGSLTEAQTRAARNVMRELTEGDSTVVDDAQAPAMADEVVHIPNGTFTINDGSEHLTFQIYTPRRGSLQGKRIIKRQLTYGEFKGFAFLTRSGGVKVWRSHYEDEARNERYIVWARILVAALHELGTDGNLPTDTTEFETTYADGAGYTIQASVFCRRCNRPLTDPTSISLRIGPECRNLEQNARTTAANAHETVSPEVIEVVSGDTITANAVTDPTIDITSVVDATITVEPPVSDAEQRLINRVAEVDRQTRQRGIYGHLACPYCTRNDFQSPQGRGRHISACRRDHRNSTALDIARARLRNYRTDNNITRTVEPPVVAVARRPISGLRNYTVPQPVRRPAPTPRTPNLSQLGTVIGGSVWEQ